MYEWVHCQYAQNGGYAPRILICTTAMVSAISVEESPITLSLLTTEFMYTHWQQNAK